MEEKRKNICRFCLRNCENSFEPIDETTREILNSLFIHLDLSISNEPLVCDNCGNKLKRCFKFKKECLCARSRALAFTRHEVDLKEDMPMICPGNTIENNAVDFSSEHSLCCFCMNWAKCISFKELEMKIVNISELIQKYFPDLGIDVTAQPTICNPCCDSLQSHCSFISDCLSVEKIIREYGDIEQTTFKEHIDLNDALSYKSKNVTETCKQEEIFCDEAKGLDNNVDIKQEDFMKGANFEGQEDVNSVLDYKFKNVTEMCKQEEMFCEPVEALDIKVEIKQENFMDAEECKLHVKPEYVFIKTEQNLCDSIQETDLVKSEPNTWGIDEEMPEAAVDSRREICAIELTHENNSNHEHVTETIEKIYKCDICSYQTNNENDFQGHVLIHKNTSETTVYKCGMCDYKSTLVDYVRKHLTVHKSTHKTVSEVPVRNCELCPYKANQEQDLEKHMQHHQNTSAYKYVVYSPEAGKLILQSHVLDHEGSSKVTTYTCEICGLQTLTRDCLTRHMLSHIGSLKLTVYDCDLCTFQTTDEGSLQRHKEIHKSDKASGIQAIYKCDTCMFQTERKSSLKNHLRCHDDIGKLAVYKCEVCDYQSKYNWHLQQHVLTHETIPSIMYMCTLCSYATKDKSDLRTHILTHNNAPVASNNASSVSKDVSNGSQLVVDTLPRCRSRLFSWISEYEELSVVNNNEIKCNICSKVIQVSGKQHITRHVEGKSHLKKLSPQLSATAKNGSKSKVDKSSRRMNRLTSWISEYEEKFSVVTNTEIMCNVCSKVIQVTRKQHITLHLERKSHLKKLSSQLSAIDKNGSHLVVEKSSQRIHRLPFWISEYGEELSVVNKTEIMCNICSKVIHVTRKHHIIQHFEGKFHLMKLGSQTRDNFNEEVCQTLLAASIPLQKINNPVLRQFLAKYTCRMIPAGSTLRKYCVPNIYNKILNTIRKNISNNYLWINADEATDTLGRCMVNVVVGTLRPDGSSDSYLVATKIIETVTAENVATVINSALDDLCINNDENRSKVLLFITDAADCMLETGKLLKTVYPNLLHITCIVHALHRVCEFICSKFKTVDTLISTFNQNFLKAPLRSLYKNICPLPLPPAPVTTRWGTWIEAALFYSKNLETLKEVISLLDNDDHSITECRIIQKPDLYHDLKYIDNNFSCLPDRIKYFETRNIPLKERVSKLKSLITHLKSIPEEFGHRLKQKVEAIYAESPDISILYLICSENIENQQTQLKYQHLIPYFKYAPLTNCDLQRTISRFMDVLDLKQSSFTETNLEYQLIINANSKVVWNTDVEEP